MSGGPGQKSKNSYARRKSQQKHQPDSHYLVDICAVNLRHMQVFSSMTAIIRYEMYCDTLEKTQRKVKRC